MNSRIFVQPSMDIPTGPLSATAKVSGTAPNTLSGAIVRPVSMKSGGQGSARLDSGKDASPPKPHVRNNDLDSYVRWLREKIEADKRDVKPVNQKPAIVRSKKSNLIQTSASEPAKFVIRKADLEAVNVETPPTAQVQLPQESAPGDATRAHSIGNQPNISSASVSKPIRPDATPSDDFFSTVTDTDLVQILDTNPVSIAPTKGVRFEELSGLGYSTDKFHRVDDSHLSGKSNQKISMPEAHVAFPEPVALKEPHDSVQISAKDTDSFISAVSKAIASVLTETPEPEFEEKVRTHFQSELHDRAIQALQPAASPEAGSDQTPESNPTDSVEEEPEMAVTAEEPVQREKEPEALSIANEPDFEPTVSIVSEAEKIAADILSATNIGIPTGVAAWDVEDFRWPVVTNQMIVSGGSAINELAESTFSMISPSYQRLAITGLGRGEGTSSIAITLARWVAAIGKKVLLVDADIVNPGLSSQVGLAPNLSWVNAVAQSLPAAEVIVRSQKSDLCVMPLAQMVSRSTWPRFIYDSLGELIDQVRSHFDLIIIDAGPSSQLLEELSLPQHLVDATLMVHDGVNSPEFQRAKSMLEGFGLNKFIVARNRTQQQSTNVA